LAIERTGAHWRASGDDPEERRQLSRLANVVISRFGTGPARVGFVHADRRLAILLVDDDRLTVIDFDDCGFS
jgi:Ser/Thr protein kinase RdoA (MazF antagonist)